MAITICRLTHDKVIDILWDKIMVRGLSQDELDSWSPNQAEKLIQMGEFLQKSSKSNGEVSIGGE